MTMTSRERVDMALRHVEPDRVPLDLGSNSETGMHVSSVYKLRQALRLDSPDTPVRVVQPYLMLGQIEPDLIEALGVDVVGLSMPTTSFGFKNEGWKPWTTFDGTPVLVPAGFNTEPEPNGDLLQYPLGDTAAPACARMPRGGLYFDAISRQEPIDEDNLNVDDNLEEFGEISDHDLEYLQHESTRLAASGKAIMANFGGTSFGDIGVVPGLRLKHPKGIRDVEEWYVSLSSRRDYIYAVFDRQCAIALRNLEQIRRVVGDSVSAIRVTAADFGAQRGPFISPKTYVALFKPFHARVNDWIHANTAWKCVIHSCGSIWRLLDDIVDAGFDAVNPVQTSAAEMDPAALKARYGSSITFWGGGIDTQRVLPFGTPAEIRTMVKERMSIFGPGGGFVFNPIHNVQAGIPAENLLALYESVRDYRTYPIA
jgi:hypothetical protein